MQSKYSIKNCKVLDDYNIQITFADRKEGTLNFRHLVGFGVFKIWEDYKGFCIHE
jgi:hypothetical protein